MRWFSFGNFFRWRWGVGVALLAGIGVGKLELNRAYERWLAADSQAMTAYFGAQEEHRYRFRQEFSFRRSEPVNRARAAEVLGAPLREVYVAPYGPDHMTYYRCKPPGTSLTVHLRFKGDMLDDYDATYPSWVVRDPWWWRPAEMARYFTAHIAALIWIAVVAGAIADRRLRRRMGNWAVFLALLAAALWLGRPAEKRALFTYEIPAGALVGLGMAVVSAVVRFWPRGHAATEPMCPHCGYNLTGNESGICPECGNVTPARAKREREEQMTLLARRLVAGE